MDFKRRMKVLKWPAFLSILMTLVGPGGAGAGAGDWAVVVVKLMARISRYNEIKRRCNRSIFSMLFPSGGDLFCLQNVNAGVLQIGRAHV